MTRNELGRIAGGTPRAVENALAELAAAYEGTGLRLQRSGDEWQIVTAPQHAPQVASYLGADRLRLSPASLETLSVVAYRQPVTRGDIEEVRGVTVSAEVIGRLEARGWVEVIGHKEVPGRPALYATTKTFLDDLGLRSLQELPPLEDIAKTLDLTPTPPPDSQSAPAPQSEPDSQAAPDESAAAQPSAV